MSRKASQAQKARWARMTPAERAAFVAMRAQKAREAVAKLKVAKR